MKETKKFLGLYAIVIIVLLLLIMFVLPDSFFSSRYEETTKQLLEANKQAQKEKEEIEKEKQKPFVDYEIQQKNILNGKYDYEYIFIDAMTTKSYTFECNGTKNGTVESGSCLTPEPFSYTEQTKKSQFSKFTDTTYMQEKNIFNLIKNVEPSIESHNLYREFTYNVKIKDLDTKIIVQTKKDNISKIILTNAYMAYMINYNNVNVDN